MRLSSLQIFRQNIDGILNQQTRLADLQEKIASGKRVNEPSDDPLSSANILLYKQKIEEFEQLQKNSNASETRVQFEETVLQSVTNTLQRLTELQVRTMNSTLGDTDRLIITEEMKTLLEDLVGLANSQDQTGEYLFAGFQSQSKPFTKDATGTYIYNGDAGQRFEQISKSLQIAVSDSGQRVFENIPSGNGSFSISDPGAANTGSGVISGSVVNQTAYVQDTYTLTFVTNSSGDLAYQVVGANSGQVIPVLPAATPASAPAYVDGSGITFNGIEVSVSGQPSVGDDFQLDPSRGQSVFKSIQDIINVLSTSAKTASERAALENGLNEGFAEIDQALTRILTVRAEVGTRLNTIDNAREINDTFNFYSHKALSELEDLDYAKAISDFQFLSTSMQAAQQTFVQIQGLSLFRFL